MRSLFAIVAGLLICVGLCGQVMLPHRRASVVALATGISPPLDIVTNQPWSAYSVTRKLRTAYAGNAYLAVRWSDTTSLGIGFTASGLVDTNALLAWAGTGTNAAYLGVLYDQSGNSRNLDWPEYTNTSNWQVTAAMLASNGVMIVDERDRPVARMPGQFTSYIRTQNLTPVPNSETNTYFVVAECYGNTNAQSVLNLGSLNDHSLEQSTTLGTSFGINNGGSTLQGYYYGINTQFLLTVYCGSNNVDLLQMNNGTPRTGQAGDAASSSPTIGYSGGAYSAQSKVSEWLIWNKQPDTNTWGIIRTNLMSFYEIVEIGDYHPTLTNSLVNSWYMEEASGTRFDSFGTNNLADSNTVTQASGKVGNAASFASANTEYLVGATNSFAGDFSVSMWVNLTSKAATMYFFSKDDTSKRSVGLYYTSGSDRLAFFIGKDGTTIAFINDSVIGSPSTGTWYHLIGAYNSANGRGTLYINNGSGQNTSDLGAGVVYASTVEKLVGATHVGAAIAVPMDGAIDEVLIFDRLLTATDRAEIYNFGLGRHIP